MNIEQRVIDDVCPLAWKSFKQWCQKPGNENAFESASSKDFRNQIGYYIDFFTGFAKESKNIRELIQSHCLIEPIDVQKNTVYQLFVVLESHIRSVKN